MAALVFTGLVVEPAPEAPDTLLPPLVADILFPLPLELLEIAAAAATGGGGGGGAEAEVAVAAAAAVAQLH